MKIISENRCRASGTIVLVRDNGKNILVDTGNPKDKDKIVQALKKQGLAPDDIDFVIITHFHSDHVGCNYLFSKARFVTPPVAFWNDIFERDEGFQKISDNIKIIATPGHTEDGVTVLVKTESGITAIVGDLFWSEEDLKIELQKKDCSNLKLFYKNRDKILKIADWIIPGHGKMFKVKNKNSIQNTRKYA